MAVGRVVSDQEPVNGAEMPEIEKNMTGLLLKNSRCVLRWISWKLMLMAAAFGANQAERTFDPTCTVHMHRHFERPRQSPSIQQTSRTMRQTWHQRSTQTYPIKTVYGRPRKAARKPLVICKHAASITWGAFRP